MSTGATELDRPVPLYMQVARQLRAQIAAGDLRDGDRLPSQREMMARWHISMQTASKVIGAMKTEGLAVPSVGRDTIVAPGAAARIAAAAQGTAHAPADSPRPAPSTAVTSPPQARPPRPARSPRSSASPPDAARCAAPKPAATTASPSASPSRGIPRPSPTVRRAWPTASRCPPEPWPTSPKRPPPAPPAPTRTTPPPPPTTRQPPRSASPLVHQSWSSARGTAPLTGNSSNTPKPPSPPVMITAAPTSSPATNLEQKVDDGFAGIAEAIEQLNQRLDDRDKEVDQRFARLEGQIAT